MSCIKNYIIPSIILALSAALPHFFKAVPAARSAQLWRGYLAVRIPATAAADIPALLEQKGCADIIRLENQRPPLESEEGAANLSVALSDGGDGYLLARRAYFFDKSGRFQLLYVPVRYARHLEDALKALAAEHGIKGAVMGAADYSRFCPLVCILLAAALTALAADKVQFASAAAAPVLYPFALPLYASAAGASLALAALFTGCGLERNERAQGNTLTRRVLMAAALLCAFTAGIKAGLLFALALCGSAAGSALYANIQEAVNGRYSFHPVRIFSAAFSERDFDKRLLALPLTSCAAGILCCFALAVPRSVAFSKGGSLLVPAPAGESGALPDLSDYINWRWRTITAPYVRAADALRSEAPAEGERVVFPRYALADGAIRASSDVFVFDDAFRAASLAAIDALSYPAVEKLLKAQGAGGQFGYSSASFQSIPLLTIIPLAAVCLLPLFFAAAGWYGAFKNRYKV